MEGCQTLATVKPLSKRDEETRSFDFLMQGVVQDVDLRPKFVNAYVASINAVQARLERVQQTVGHDTLDVLQKSLGRVPPKDREIKKLKEMMDNYYEDKQSAAYTELDERLKLWQSVINIVQNQKGLVGKINRNQRVRVREAYPNIMPENAFQLFQKYLIHLRNMVGLRQFKERLAERILVWLNRPKEFNEGYLNVLLLGNPGTGKTTAGMLLAQIYQSMGVLTLTEVERETPVLFEADLISGYQGNTAGKTVRAFRNYLGGAVLLDEAYTLDGEGYTKEAIDTLVGLLSSFKGIGMWMFAGYEERIHETLLEANPGMDRRLRDKFVFDPFNVNDLSEIFRRKKGEDNAKYVKFTWNDEVTETVRTVICIVYESGLLAATNASGIMSFYREVTNYAVFLYGGGYQQFRTIQEFEPVPVTVEAVKRGADRWLSSVETGFRIAWTPEPEQEETNDKEKEKTNDKEKEEDTSQSGEPSTKKRRREVGHLVLLPTHKLQELEPEIAEQVWPAVLRRDYPEVAQTLNWGSIKDEDVKHPVQCLYEFLENTRMQDSPERSATRLVKGGLEAVPSVRSFTLPTKEPIMLPKDRVLVARGLFRVGDQLYTLSDETPLDPESVEWRPCRTSVWRVGALHIASRDRATNTVSLIALDDLLA